MRLSLIVPVFNTAPFLGDCLDSILKAAPLRGVEVLLFDDGSTDESCAIAKNYAARAPQLFRLLQGEHKGLSAARNRALSYATGDYIAFLDSDDLLAPAYFSRLFQAMEKAPDLILLRHSVLTEKGLSVPRRFSSPNPVKASLLAPPMVWLRVCRRALLEGEAFAEGLWYEDLDLSLRLTLKARTFSVVEEPLYHYRQRAGSLSQSTGSPHTEDIFPIVARVLAVMEKEGALTDYHPELEWLFIQHLLRSAALRFAHRPDGKALFARLTDTVEQTFPAWRSNPYLKESSFPLRTAVRLCAAGHPRLLHLLSRGKELFL